jgi:hypothetical protein
MNYSTTMAHVRSNTRDTIGQRQLLLDSEQRLQKSHLVESTLAQVLFYVIHARNTVCG